jgi:predicted negative regulator of RcsB-dependent stress response
MEKRLSVKALTLLLIFLVLGLYYPAIFAPINSVDDPGMYNYLLNKEGFCFQEIFFPGGKGTYYRPLLIVSFLIDKYLWGLEESFMHLQNIILHVGNSLLLFAIAFRVGRMLAVMSPLPAFLAALFFAIHPINTESVAWISGRTDLLAGLFILLSVNLLLTQAKSFLALLISGLCLLLACLAKETAIFFLPAAFVFPFFLSSETIDRIPLYTVCKKYFPHFVIFTFVGTVYVAFRLTAFSGGDEGIGSFATHLAGSRETDLLLSVKMLLKAAGFYLKKLVVPFPLNFAILRISDLYVIPGIVLFAALVLILVRRKLSDYFFVAAASLGVSALIIPLLRVTWTPLAERYMYIPSAFFLVGITFSIQQWQGFVKYKRIFTVIIVALVTIFCWGTAQRNLVWQNNLSLFTDTSKKTPDFAPAQNEMAHALYAVGRVEEAGSIIKSMKVSEELRNYQYGQISKAAALANEGDTEGARNILRHLLSNPGRHEVIIIQRLLKLNYADLQGDKAERNKFYDENVHLLTRLYELTGDVFFQYRLGQVYMHKGENSKAMEAFQRVVAHTTEKVYYHLPAKKLMEKLSTQEK